MHSNSLPHIRCFPDFELFINKTPVSFKSRKAKELLALLVHYEGNWVPIDKITFCLLENCEEHSSKNYSRTILYRLKQALAPYHLEQIVESAYGKMRVHTEQFTCDYYDYLQGQTELFQGDYMGEYPWAETTVPPCGRRWLNEITVLQESVLSHTYALTITNNRSFLTAPSTIAKQQFLFVRVRIVCTKCFCCHINQPQ